ncbi:unnamed protein product, partial [Closterium sp. Naga37s-1]
KEVIVLGRLSHPHLVRLHGYCMEGHEALLVYEFMTRGSLDKALLDSASGELFFSWNMRLKVAVQVAEALAYLHGANLIHRDLKAANVLLSPEYDAKLTDFGMVRVGPDRQLQSIVSTRVMGTRGYTDPSYMETGHLGAKSDVYSFGVLLLELVTGRRVVDEGERMVIECRTRLSDLTLKAAEYIDPRLGNQYPERGARGLATLARHCVADDRRTRPEIGTVVEKLKLLVRACENDEAEAAAKAAAVVKVFENDEVEAAAEAAALEAGGSGLVEGGDTVVNGGLATLARHSVVDNWSVRPDIGIVPDKLRLLVKVCESDEVEAAAQAAALEAGGSGSVEGGDMEVNGGDGGSSTAVAPPVVKIVG